MIFSASKLVFSVYAFVFFGLFGPNLALGAIVPLAQYLVSRSTVWRLACEASPRNGASEVSLRTERAEWSGGASHARRQAVDLAQSKATVNYYYYYYYYYYENRFLFSEFCELRSHTLTLGPNWALKSIP